MAETEIGAAERARPAEREGLREASLTKGSRLTAVREREGPRPSANSFVVGV
jgi:hypothetical protein